MLCLYLNNSDEGLCIMHSFYTHQAPKNKAKGFCNIHPQKRVLLFPFYSNWLPICLNICNNVAEPELFLSFSFFRVSQVYIPFILFFYLFFLVVYFVLLLLMLCSILPVFIEAVNPYRLCFANVFNNVVSPAERRRLNSPFSGET